MSLQCAGCNGGYEAVIMYSTMKKDAHVNRENHHFGAWGVGLQIVDFGLRIWQKKDEWI